MNGFYWTVSQVSIDRKLASKRRFLRHAIPSIVIKFHIKSKRKQKILINGLECETLATTPVD